MQIEKDNIITPDLDVRMTNVKHARHNRRFCHKFLVMSQQMQRMDDHFDEAHDLKLERNQDHSHDTDIGLNW